MKRKTFFDNFFLWKKKYAEREKNRERKIKSMRNLKKKKEKQKKNSHWRKRTKKVSMQKTREISKKETFFF